MRLRSTSRRGISHPRSMVALQLEALLEGQKLLANKRGMDVYQQRMAKASMAVLYPILWNWDNTVSRTYS
eukprot:COSAG05_NODE_879_length_6800_cov_2.047903_2_plen_70_part_00